MKSLRMLTLITAATAPLAFAPVEVMAAQEKTTGQSPAQTVAGALRSVPASKGRLVKKGMQLKSKSSAITCCTHWNTSTGGTGCSTQPGASVRESNSRSTAARADAGKARATMAMAASYHTRL